MTVSKTPTRRRKSVPPLTYTTRAEKLEVGDFVIGMGEIEKLFIRQLVVVFVKGEPHVWSRQKTVEIVLEDGRE